jgi:hypothetical protein
MKANDYPRCRCGNYRSVFLLACRVCLKRKGKGK